LSEETLTPHDAMIGLLNQAQVAHDKLYSSDDDNWPIWYGGYLTLLLCVEFDLNLTQSQVVQWLIQAESDRLAISPETDRPTFFATHFLTRYLPSWKPETDRLSLYMTPWCPFCARVERVIKHLGLEVEYRDISSNAEFQAELIEVRNRATVPVLRIDCDEGKTRWLPESQDIIVYLEHKYRR